MSTSTIKQIESLGMTWNLMINGRGEFSCAAWNHAGACIAETGPHKYGDDAIAELDGMALGLVPKSGFSSKVCFQTAVRLATKAWMMFVETGSPAARRAWERMTRLAQSLQVPAGALRAQLWIDIQSIEEQAGKMGYLDSVVISSK